MNGTANMNMYDRYNDPQGCRQTLIAFIVAVLLIILAIALHSCKTPTPTLPTNTHSHDRDSVRTEYVHDSIYTDRWHTIYMRGDTIFIHDSIYTDRWRKKEVHDSVYINNTDTIYQTVEIIKQGSKFLRNSGIALWIIIVLAIAAAVIGIVIKFAK